MPRKIPVQTGNRHVKFFLALAILVGFALLGWSVSEISSTQSAELQKEIEKLQKEVRELQAQYQEIKQEISRLRSPSALDDVNRFLQAEPSQIQQPGDNGIQSNPTLPKPIEAKTEPAMPKPSEPANLSQVEQHPVIVLDTRIPNIRFVGQLQPQKGNWADLWDIENRTQKDIQFSVQHQANIEIIWISQGQRLSAESNILPANMHIQAKIMAPITMQENCEYQILLKTNAETTIIPILQE